MDKLFKHSKMYQVVGASLHKRFIINQSVNVGPTAKH